MRIESDKLIIQPLSEEELKLYILSEGELEKHLGLNTAKRQVPGKVKAVITNKILPQLEKPDCIIYFHTFWTVISREHNTMVADILFKGEPNDNNEVEIGYGTYSDFQGHGFMTETVKLMVNWAFSKGIIAVIAETDIINTASQKVLQKNNFIVVSESADNIRWRLQNYIA